MPFVVGVDWASVGMESEPMMKLRQTGGGVFCRNCSYPVQQHLAFFREVS